MSNLQKNSLKNRLWCERYRPKTIDEYVFQDLRQKSQVLQMINEKSIPHILMSGVQGSGKAQPLTAKIHTPTGWNILGNIKIGDDITTPSGDISKVTGIFPQGYKDIYTITFHDGAKTDCCLDHLWECYYVDNYTNRTATKHIVDTKTIIEYMDKQSQRKVERFNVSIPLIKCPIEFNNNTLLNIPPYIMGVLLGDGSLCGPSPRITSIDQEITDKVSLLLTEDYKLCKIKNTTKEYIISQNNPINLGGKIGRVESMYTSWLKQYNIHGKKSFEKSIPIDYLFSSVENRLELIRGLLDTDGTVGQRGNISYTTTSSTLSKQVQEIIWSLGGTCTITSRIPTYTYKGEKKQGRVAYILHIAHPTPSALFSLSRKIERCGKTFAEKHNKGNITLRRRIKSINYKGGEDAQCIMIDHPDHLYITDDYIVTHNTTLSFILIDAMGLDETDVRIINASDENSVDTIREKVKDFVSTAPMGEFKIILLEEADYISPNGQAVMRRLMEEFSDNARFILTCVTGDTKVYSPYGFSSIENTYDNQQILSNNNKLLQNKYTKQSITTNILEIKTLHNQHIKSTPDHTFLTLTGPIISVNLKENDSILINVNAMYGNSFQYESCVDFFDINNFKYWLSTEKSLPLLDEIEFLSNENYYDPSEQLTTTISVNSILNNLNLKFDDDKILSMGRLIGMLHGDGHLSTNIHFTADNKDTLNKIIKDINKFKQVEINISKNENKTNELYICFNDISLMLLFEYFGAVVGNKTKQYRKLPIWCNFTLFSKGFLQGLFDADATWCFVDKKNDKTISPIILNQYFSKENEDETFMKDIVNLLNKFNISSTVGVTIPSSATGFDNHLTDRIIKQVQITKQEDIKQYLLSIGNYYDKPNSDDILGYLMYQKNQSGYFDTFTVWKQKYYINGYINDNIISIIHHIDNNIPVYDCCFEDYHWYITNGFVSHNCNYVHKIIPAIRSRCTTKFNFKAADRNDIAEYLITVLASEQVVFDLELLDKYITAGYPDIRTILGSLQQHTVNGKLYPPPEEGVNTDDYKFKLIEYIERDKWTEARNIVCANVIKEEYEDLYRFLYENVSKSPKFQSKDNWEEAIIIIAEHLYKHTSCADAEINFAAMAIKLGMI